MADGPEAAAALLDEARRIADGRGVDYLELRSEKALPDEGLLTKDLYVTFRADLTEGEEALLEAHGEEAAADDELRRQGAGFTTRVAGIEELPLFYGLFCQSMRYHGTPVYPRRFLAEILDRHPADTNLFFVYHEGRPVAGVLNVLWGDVVMPYYAGADRRGERPRGVDDFLYLAIMRWGREHGFRTFDFGRSKRGTGALKFKERWGMEEVPLAYQYHLGKAKALPNVSPANPKYEAAIRIWQKLPLPVTQPLGPMIVKRVP